MTNLSQPRQLNCATITPPPQPWTLTITSPGQPFLLPGLTLPPTITDFAMPCRVTEEWAIKLPFGTVEES